MLGYKAGATGRTLDSLITAVLFFWTREGKRGGVKVGVIGCRGEAVIS